MLFSNLPLWANVLSTILIVVLIILAALYFWGRKMQGKVASQQTALLEASQVVSILVIDKKKLKISESGLPKIVQDSIPAYMRFRKMPIVKAKIGPRVMSLVADDKIFKLIPLKKEIKCVVAGIYITEIKSGGLHVEDKNKKKK